MSYLPNRSRAEELGPKGEAQGQKFTINPDDAPIAIYEIDLSTLKFKWLNDYVSPLLGYTEQELLAVNIANLLDDSSKTTFQKNIVDSLEGKKTYFSTEVGVKAKNGTILWGLFNSKVIFRNGVPSSVLVFAQDRTESKKAEEAMRLSEEKFSKAFLNSPFGVTLTRFDDGTVMDANNAASNIFGYSIEEVVGRNSIPFWADSTHRQELINELSEKGAVRDRELVFKRKNGSLFNVNMSGSIIRINGQKCLLSTFIDITERKKAEEALKESEALYRTLFDNTEDGFMLLEPVFNDEGKASDFRFLKLNEAYEHQTGAKAADVLGKLASKVSPQLDPEIAMTSYKVVETGKSIHNETYNSYSRKWFDSYYFQFVNGSVGILFRDITERKNLEKQLQESERLAAIGQTAGMVGHDIRNPLQAIINELYIAEGTMIEVSKGNMPQAATDSLSFVQQQISYINKIVLDLQDYARRLTPDLSAVDLSQLFDNLFSTVAIPDNIKVNLVVGGTIIFWTDATFIKRALANLVTNAVQAMPKGGVLTLSAYKTKDTLVLTVSDTGDGIPESIKPDLFKPLMTTKAKGQGLGLAVVKRLVEALNGTVLVESEEGKGTQFIITLRNVKTSRCA